MRFDYKIAFFVVCFFFIAFFYSMLSLEKQSYNDFESKIDSLTAVNSDILNEMILDRVVIKGYEKTIDSLAQVKKKIIIQYIQKSNEIKNYTASSLVLEFDSIFSGAKLK